MCFTAAGDMHRYLCSTVCLLMLTGSALPADRSCADRDINVEGSDAVITTAICHGDGRVDYEWRALIDPMYRLQIEYSCYDAYKEVASEGTTVLLSWGGPYEGRSDSFNVADWGANTTCVLYGCYEVETEDFDYHRHLLSPVNCSAPAPVSSLVVLPSTSLSIQTATTEVLEITQSPLGASVLKELTTSPLAQQHDMPEEEKDNGRIDNLDIYIITGVFLAFFLALAVVSTFVGAFQIKRSKDKKRARLPVLDPQKSVDKNAELVQVYDLDRRPVEPDSVTNYELLDILYFEESPHPRHQTRTAGITEGATNMSSILGPTPDGVPQGYIVETSDDLLSTMTESGGSCGPPSLSETSRQLAGSLDGQTDKGCDSVTSDERASIPIYERDTEAISQGEEISLSYLSYPPTPEQSACVSPGYVVLQNHTDAGSSGE